MLTRAELIKSELIDDIAEAAQQRMAPGRADLVGRFIRWFYANVPPNDFLHERPDNLYGAAVSMLAFAEHYTPGHPKIRVYTPRLDRDGWHSPHTVVDIINDDMPFLVDSVTMELNRLDADVRLVIHPIFVVERDSAGRLAQLQPANADVHHTGCESFMHLKIRAQPPESHAALEQALTKVLSDVRTTVDDFESMRARCREVISDLQQNSPPVPAEERDITVAFLTWLNENHFTYLGYRYCVFLTRDSERRVSIRPDAGLGLLRHPDRTVVEGFRAPATGEFLRIFKANTRSTIHRPVHMDVISIPSYDTSGQLLGEHLFVGLFTLDAYSRSPEYIPVLREKIRRTLEHAQFSPRSHNGKALRYILETYPRDELFQITEPELLSIATGILHLQRRQRVALFVRHDPFERFVSCLVYVPRDRFDTALRLKMQEVLSHAYGGSVAAYYTHLSDEPLAHLHVIVRTPHGALPDLDLASVERKLHEATRSWDGQLEEALINEHGEEHGSLLARRYGKAFPAGYREDFDAYTAVNDLDFIEDALQTGELRMNLYRRVEAKAHELHFKLYSPRRYVPLSDIMPVLENMGVRVIVEVPYDVRPDGTAETHASRESTSETLWMHDFIVETEGEYPVDLPSIKDAFQDTFARVLHGQMENDGLNQLVIYAGLAVRDIDILRAYLKYLRQLQVPFSRTYMQQTLRHNAEITRLLTSYFRARFDPEGATKDATPQLLQRLLEQLEAVASLDEDRILRRFLNLIDATVRTNFFQTDASGAHKPYVSFKLDMSLVDELPPPRPYREIFVSGPRVEGVHLRFGKVARGGLRWSDRLEDFRTEVLGLVKAQQVKNAVNLQFGSKGGFVVKNPPPPDRGRDAALAEGIACYQMFIQGLLDVTDNLTTSGVQPPPQVMRHDGDDPYLVVAADKGTATFSDIANAISATYGFWLDDAFASGGSAGYDHKKMGITARGAWESVKRHFRELDKDIQSEEFTCAGVGDMSGDVFGNGMLLSRRIKLVAAFDHLHIFVDPDPDPEASWRERKRLFDMPRSRWTDYAPELLSKGGGIYDRGAKSVSVSPEMAALLDLKKTTVTPNDLIRAILASRVELLWFGGIGTYVKGRDETHSDVGDRANDAVRIDAEALRAQVIGEGANLALTQRARIQYALRGGRANTDFIDNSAGVDCSDHEVNIKILLGEVERAGDITRKQRDILLREMTEEVAALVLRDNYLQTQTLAATQGLGSYILNRLARFMQALERAGRLDRGIEFLPDQDAIEERHRQGIGLTRPELAVLMAYAKNALYEDLLETELPDVPYLERDLLHYFPTPLRERYPQAIRQHRLRREIVATVVTNEIINRMGIAYVHETREKTGLAPSHVAMAYVAAREILGIASLWKQVEALDNQAKANVQVGMLVECARLVDRVSVWLLREHGSALDVEALRDRYAAGVAEVSGALDDVISVSDRQATVDRAQTFREARVPDVLATRVAQLPLLTTVCDVVTIATEVGRSVVDVAQVYFEIGHRFGFEWLRRVAHHLPTERTWDKHAVHAVLDDLAGAQRELTLRVLRTTEVAQATASALDAWAETRKPLLTRTQQLMNELEAVPSPDFAILAVANRHLKALIAG